MNIQPLTPLTPLAPLRGSSSIALNLFPPEQKEKILGALALMELANGML
jgi:hypothetical protein